MDEWINEPAKWSAGADGELFVTADPDTDLWRTTHYGFVRDTGHVRGRWVEGDCSVTTTFSADYTDLYDQAGVALRIDAENWIKAGVELVDGEFQISAVVTRGVSDWSVIPVAHADRVTISAERVGDTVTVRYGLGDDLPRTMLRLAYFPPGPPALVGVMCAAPTGSGFDVRFERTLVGP
jgi:regulation of enolase protein 1 (concanavalin A-like superfamily)